MTIYCSLASFNSFSFHLSMLNQSSKGNPTPATQRGSFKVFLSTFPAFHPRDIDMMKVELIEPYLSPSGGRNPSLFAQRHYCPHDQSG
jgi:hypothetical protein